MKLSRSNVKLTAAFVIVAILASSFGAAYVRATISSAPSSIVSQYSCEKGPDYVLSVDNAATPNYYAVAGSGSPTIPCGQLVFGGPNNVGAVTGTSFNAVLGAVIASGTTILVEDGTYILTTTFADSTHSNVTLDGASQQAIIKVKAGFGSNNAFTLTGVKLWTISGLAFDFTGMTQGTGNNFGIALRGAASYITVSGNTFKNGGQAQVDAAGNATVYPTFISYLNNICQTGTGYNALEADVFTRNAIVAGNQIVGGTNGIEMDSAANVATTGNSISGVSAVGIDTYDFSNTASNITITANVITKPGGNGIRVSGPTIGGSSTVANGVSIVANVISSSANNGIYVFPRAGYTATEITIDSNTLRQVGGNGIYASNASQVAVTGNTVISNSGQGIQLVTVTNWIISSNSIYQPTASGINIASSSSGSIVGNSIVSPGANNHGITLSSGNVAVTGNTITLTNTGGNAIAIQSGVNNVAITGNYLTGLTSEAAVSPKGTNLDIVVSYNQFVSWLYGIRESAGDDYGTYIGNDMKITVTTPISNIVGTHDFIENNQGYNPVAVSTYTACASVCTYTNVDGYDETFTLLAINGISAWTCNGHAEPITLTDVTCTIAPGGSQVITWTVTAPTFTKVPLVA